MQRVAIRTHSLVAVIRAATDRRILALAVPTLGALLAQPLFVLVDTAMVGHLGVPQLAGLSVAGTLVSSVVGLLVFLAYQTTASVARLVGSGRPDAALRSGIDGLWFAGLLGILAFAALMLFGGPLVRALGADGEVADQALAYVRAAAPGVVGMLVTYAATGTLRGLSRVRIILVVTVSAAVMNAALNALLIYGVGLGVAGSGLGTSITELTMAAVLVAAVRREAVRLGVPLRPTRAGAVGAGRDGFPLFVRTLSLRASMLLTVWVAASLGAVSLSAHQIVISLWLLSAYALDAVAIAAQTLIGEALGGGRPEEARALLRRCLAWGIGSGLVVGGVFALTAPWLPLVFTPDDGVRSVATVTLWIAAAFVPLAGFVFVLDGVLIGAGDGRYLAWTGIVNLATYVPFALVVVGWRPEGGLAWLWVSYCVAYMGSRAVTLGLRARSDDWLVLGASSRRAAAAQ